MDNANAPAVAEICVRLDGLPLAIELAAARIKLLPPQAMLARLGRRLELLARGRAGRSGAASDLAAGHCLELRPAGGGEQALFRRLAVFRGAVRWRRQRRCARRCTTLRQASGRSLEVLDGVASLLDKSLLRQQEQASGEPRFRMLETIREYAWSA